MVWDSWRHPFLQCTNSAITLEILRGMLLGSGSQRSQKPISNYLCEL